MANSKPTDPLRAILLSGGLLIMSLAFQLSQAKGWADFIPDWVVYGLWFVPIIPLGLWLAGHERLKGARGKYASSFRDKRKTTIALSVLAAGIICVCLFFIATRTWGFIVSHRTKPEVPVSVSQTQIEVSWSDPAPITYGTKLSEEQLNAVPSAKAVPVYSPAVGDALPVGRCPLTVTFTPEDRTKYAITSKTVYLVVNISDNGLKHREPIGHAQTQPPAKSPVPESSIQLMGLSIKPGNSNSPLSFQPQLNYQVVGGTVYHLKSLAVGFATTTDIDLPEMTGKLYRAASSMFDPGKIREIPESTNSEAFSITPGIAISSSGDAQGTFAIIYTHATWDDRLGVPGELTKCFETKIMKGQIDSQTQWSLCQVSARTDFDVKYETMSSAELQTTLLNLEATIRQEEGQKEQDDRARFLNHSSISKETFEAQQKAELDSFRAEGEHYVKSICPSLEPLVEEIMFRFSYIPYWYIQKPVIDKTISSHQEVDGKIIQQMTMTERSLIRRTIIGCTEPGGYHPPLRDVADTLDLLNTGLTEALRHGMPLTVPFGARLQR